MQDVQALPSFRIPLQIDGTTDPAYVTLTPHRWGNRQWVEVTLDPRLHGHMVIDRDWLSPDLLEAMELAWREQAA